MAAAQSLRPGHIIRARGEAWVVHRHIAGTHGSVLEVLGRGADNRGTRTSFLLPYEPIERLPSSETPRVVRPRTWRTVARSILATATPSYEALRTPARAAVAVLPFQLEPALAIVRGIATRVLIADEVGLGKTIQAGLIIGELLERRPEAHVLVVTPAGLREQWQAELRERFARDATLLDSASMSRHATQWNGNPWAIPGVVLTSLDFVKRPEVVRALESLVWDLVVFDEAHALAGRSDRAMVASLLSRRARTLVLLTATPHSGDEDAFTRLTSLGDFSRAFPLLAFRRTRLDIGLPSARRSVSLRVRLTRGEFDMHETLMAYARLVWAQASATRDGARLAMMVLTRRACSSASSLARSVETRLRLLPIGEETDLLQMPLPFGDPAADDDAPGAELSSPGLADRHEERRWLEHLLQLARLAEQSESKFRVLHRLLRRSRERAIVFTEYRDTLDRLAHYLRELAPAQLHGGMSGTERRDVLLRFAAGDVRVLLATDAASEGLNLHHRCRLVINLELPWTPVRLEQRIGRVERLGQKRRVHAVHLLAANTCEEASVAVLLTRMRRVSGVLGGMRATAYEQEIAGIAIGSEEIDSVAIDGERRDPSAAQAPLPPGVVIGALRSAATEEAARIEHVRRLGGNVRHEPFESRPCVTAIRTGRARFVNDWIYRLVFEDPELQPIWTTLVGIRERAPSHLRSNASIRRHAASITRLAESAVMPVANQLLSSFLSTFHRSQLRAMERERAIADGLRQQHARLATSLLQPGLFDRRAERAAAAQNATLEEALERCARRLAECDRHTQVSIDCRLVFGLVRR